MMTHTDKLAMLLRELHISGADYRDMAELLLETAVAMTGVEGNKEQTDNVLEALVEQLLCASIRVGYLDKTPWRKQ